MRESRIESYARQQCEKLGWQCRKLIDWSRAGFPDRTVLAPGSKIAFLELKAEKGKLSMVQTLCHRSLRKLGFMVFVPHSKEDVDEALQEMQKAWGVL
jgi:hypothetical protein